MSTFSPDVVNTFDDYDTQADGAPPDILRAETAEKSYFDLKQELIVSDHKTLRDIAASTIQNQWRIWKVHQHFRKFLFNFRKLRLKRERPIFNLLLLNSYVGGEKRRQYYEETNENKITWRDLYISVKKSSFELFTATNLMFIPSTENDQILIKFTRQCAKPLLSKVFTEWRILKQRSKYEKKITRYDSLCVRKFGSLYTTFEVWYKYTLLKKKQYTTSNFPQWENIIKRKKNRAQVYEDALQIFKKTLKRRVITSLSNKMVNRRIQDDIVKEADVFRDRQILKLGNAAWTKFMDQKKSKMRLERSVIFNWWTLVQSKKYNKMLFKTFVDRSSYLKKRTSFNALMKNVKIEKAIEINGNMKLANNMSLSLYLAFTLLKKPDNAALALSFHEWRRFVRGRRFWVHFIFADIRASQYDPLKKKAFEILRKAKQRTIINQSFNSKAFQMESMQIYETVMTKNDPRGEFYLLSYDKEIEDELAQTKTPLQQVEVFTKAWQKMKSDPSLFKRIILLYKAKMESQKNTESIPERTKRLYMTSMNNLSMMGYLSEEKWRQIIKLQNENQIRMFRNRQMFMHNDNIIMLSHDSHNEAKEFEKKSTFFKTLQKPYKIQENLLKKVEEILPLSSIKPADNVPEFVLVQGVRSVPYSFKSQLKQIRKQIADDRLKMSAANKSDKKHLKILNQQTSNEARRRSTVSNIHNESFNTKTIESEVEIRPQTGINQRLNGIFPPLYKKGTPSLNVQLVKFSNDFEYNVEEKGDSDDENIPLNALEMSQAAKEMLSEARFQQSMVFGSSFASLLSSSAKISRFSFQNLPPFEDKDEYKEEQTIDEEIDEESDDLLGLSQRTGRQTGRKSSLKEEVEENNEEEEFQTMKTLSELDDPEDTMKTKKYQDFLSILFGKTVSANQFMKLNTLRKRIKDEITSRRANAAIGLDTVGNSFGITNVLGEYRYKKKKLKKSKAKSDRKSKSNKVSDEEKEGEEYEVKYNSRKFMTKKGKDGLSSEEQSDYSDDENDSNNEEINEDRDDLMNEKKDIEEVLSDNDENLNDVDIDAAEEEKNSEKESDSGYEYDEYEYQYDYDYEYSEEEVDGEKKRVKKKVKKNKRKVKISHGKNSMKFSNTKSATKSESQSSSITNPSSNVNEGTTKRIRKKKLKDHALKEVNKIVFKMLENSILERFGTEEGPLVEVDPNYVPELDLPEKKIDDAPVFVTTNITKPKVQKKHEIFKAKTFKKPARIVIPDRKEMDQTVYNAILEGDKFATVTYNNGTNTVSKRPTTTVDSNRFMANHHYQPVYRFSAGFQNRGLHFEDEEKVVSFGGGDKRHISSNNVGFMQVRINNMKRKGLTKPITTSPQPKTIPELRATSSQSNSRQNKTVKDDGLQILERKTMTFVQTLSSYTNDHEFNLFVRNVTVLPKMMKPVIDPNISVQFDSVMASYCGCKPMDNNSLEMFKTVDQATALSEFVQKLIILLTTKKASPQDCSRASIKLFKTQPQHILILQRCVNLEANDRKQGQERMKRMRNENNTQNNGQWIMKQRKTVTFADVGWVRSFEYRFVSLQFGDDNSAIIAPIDQMIETRGTGTPPSSRPPSIINKKPQKEDKQKTQQNVKEILQKFSECKNDKEMESVLGNFDLDELVSVARYIASDEEMESLLSK